MRAKKALVQEDCLLLAEIQEEMWRRWNVFLNEKADGNKQLHIS